MIRRLGFAQWDCAARGLVCFVLLATLAACATNKPPPVAEPMPAAPVVIAPPEPAAPPPPKPRPPKPKPKAVEEDLWTRFARTRHWQPCVRDAGIDRWVSRYAGSPQRFATTLAPLLPLMDYVLTRSEALGLPAEVMLVPIVESYYRPDARGPGGALGLWQLMPDTGTRFGLLRRGSRDDRTDVRASTAAALRLLVLNSEAFSGNPKLMFAAYNAGAYRLRKALGGRDHQTLTSLEGLGLSRTTEEYLSKIKALGCLLGEPELFSLELPEIPPRSRLIEFTPPFAIDPRAVSERIGVPQAQLRSWNASAFAQGAADAAMPLLIPQASEPVLSAALAGGSLSKHTPSPEVASTVAAPSEKPQAAARTHRVAAGDSLWEIAKRYRVRLADLMRWNALNKRSVLRIGQRLRLDPP